MTNDKIWLGIFERKKIMSRITKSLAESIASSLLAKKKEKISHKRQELKEKVTQVIEQTIPEDVLKFHESNQDWMRGSQDFRLQGDGTGTDYTHYRTTKTLPSNSQYNWVKIPDKSHNEVMNLHSKIDKMESDLKKARFEVETAIFNLRTYSNLEKEFPEAAKYLPKNGTTALVVNIDKVRQLIK
jgi:hypothetical protein